VIPADRVQNESWTLELLYSGLAFKLDSSIEFAEMFYFAASFVTVTRHTIRLLTCWRF